MGEPIDPSALSRRPTTFADGSEGREYYHPDIEGGFPSVTTVLNNRIDPSKTEGIEGWMNWYDGSEQRRSPHWLDQRRYKARRGTLAHFAVAKQLDPSIEQTDEERDSLHELKNWWAYKPSSYDWMPVDSDEAIPSDAFEEPSCPSGVFDTVSEYHQTRRDGKSHSEALTAVEADTDVSIDERKWAAKTTNQHDGRDAYLRAMQDISYVGDAFETVRPQLEIAEVLDIERYVIDEEWKYAGQFDILYEDSEGRTVLGDLKTSSALRESYQLQLAAYAHALDEPVDRLVVIRIYPDNEEVEVSFDDDWEMSKDGLAAEFLALCERTQTDTLGNAVTEKGVFF